MYACSRCLRLNVAAGDDIQNVERHRAAFQACRAEIPALDQATRGRWTTEIRATD
jgi:hypothetical protein